MTKMSPKLIVISTIILSIWLLPAAARTYRWVDENGTTIYSQSPPPNGKATIIKPPPPSPSQPGETMKKLKARLDAIDETNKKKNEAKDKEDIAAKNAAIKRQNCENAKKNLTTLEQHARVRLKGEDGSYKMLSEEERTAQIDKAKEAIKNNCE